MKMNNTPSIDKYTHVKMTCNNALIFNAKAVSIAILDRLGKSIWRKERGLSAEPIVWEGIDSFGINVGPGSLTCKITYPDNVVIYVPFVFLQK